MLKASTENKQARDSRITWGSNRDSQPVRRGAGGAEGRGGGRGGGFAASDGSAGTPSTRKSKTPSPKRHRDLQGNPGRNVSVCGER